MRAIKYLERLKRGKLWAFGRRIFVFIYFCLVTCPVMGQGKQMALQESDYHLWSTLTVDKISDEGKWASYYLRYTSQRDTLFVKNTSDGKLFHFEQGTEGTFNGDKWFACLGRNDSLHIQNLQTGRRRSIKDVTQFAFSGNGKYLVALIKTATTPSLLISAMDGKTAFSIPNVSSWKFDPKRTSMVYCSKFEAHYSVDVLLLARPFVKTNIATNNDGGYLNLQWKGNSIAFVQPGKDNAIVYRYHVGDKKLMSYDPAIRADFPKALRVSPLSYSTMVISDDEERIFFDLKERNIPIIANDDVQVWQGDDRVVFPHKKFFGEPEDHDKFGVWNITTDRFLQITDRDYPTGFLSGDYKHALVYDPIAYEPQANFDSPFDVYIMDLLTGQRKLVLEKYTGDKWSLRFSPGGHYFIYPKDNHWWVYNISQGTHICITRNITVPFFPVVADIPAEPHSYKDADWDAEDRFVFLYDEYDVWQVSPDGLIYKRLTNGSGIGRTYRLKDLVPGTYRDPKEVPVHNFDLNTGIFLEGSDKITRASGFYLLQKDKTEQEIVWQTSRLGQYRKSRKNDVYVYIAQHYDRSPQLAVYAKNKERYYY